MTSSIRQLPLRQHGLVLKAQLTTVRRNYAVRDVPKVVFKTVMGWAEEYVEGNRIKDFEGLWERVEDRNCNFLETLIVLEQVPPEHLEECVEKTRNLLMGVE